MGHPPEPACGCRPRNCSSLKNPFPSRRTSGNGHSTCRARLATPRARSPSWPGPTLIARGTEPRTRYRVHTSAKTPVHSDARVVANRSRQRAAQQRFAVMHEIPIRISIQVRGLQHYTQILNRQVIRNTIKPACDHPDH